MTNYDRLGEGLKLFRDALRPIIVHHLRTAYPQDDWMEQSVFPYLWENQAQSLRQGIERASVSVLFEAGKKPEEHLDLQHFGPVVRGNWERIFKSVFKDTFILGCVQEAGRARNVWAHPPTNELPTADVNRVLDSCARVLMMVDADAGKKVAALRDQTSSESELQHEAQETEKLEITKPSDGRETTTTLLPAPQIQVPFGVVVGVETTNEAGNNQGSDFPDAFGLWQSLHNYLKVEVECDAPENVGRANQATVRIVVRNTAPVRPGWPDIVFEEVAVGYVRPGTSGGLRRDGGTGSSSIKGGETTAWNYQCGYAELASVRFHVKAKLSLSSFFSFGEEKTIPITLTKPLVQPYFQEFNRL